MVEYPSAFVMIVCKTLSIGTLDANSDFTHWQNREWDMTEGKMHCRRIEMTVTPQNDNDGPFNQDKCWHTALTLGPRFDTEHPNSPYRFWRVACPVKIVDVGRDGLPGTADDVLIGYKLPECPTLEGKVECDQDTAI